MKRYCSYDNRSNASNCSGFEKLAINLSLKIALSKLSNLSLPSFLILDESLSCIDDQNMDKINKLFAYLKKTYDFVLVITHNTNIHSKFDNIIHIKKINGDSKIVC